MQHQRVIIIGGGPVGLTCALLCALQKISVTILEPNPGKFDDKRLLALSYATFRSLHDLGVGLDDGATPINKVHISHRGLGVSNILASDLDLPHLGYTIKYSDLCQQLYHIAHQSPYITWHTGKVKDVIPGQNFASVTYTKEDDRVHYFTAELIIMAQGGGIKIKGLEYKEYDYEQLALTTELITQYQSSNVAYERLDNRGACVMLPNRSNFTLVWSLPKSIAQDILSEQSLVEHLKKLSFMKRFGKLEVSGEVAAFPLKLQMAPKKALDRVVLIGNSAQIIHPISAQGMNVALRDALVLSELVAMGDLSPVALSKFNQLRNSDTNFVTGFTHKLAQLVKLRCAVVSHLMSAGIIALSNCKPLQNEIANSLIFGR